MTLDAAAIGGAAAGGAGGLPMPGRDVMDRVPVGDDTTTGGLAGAGAPAPAGAGRGGASALAAAGGATAAAGGGGWARPVLTRRVKTCAVRSRPNPQAK